MVETASSSPALDTRVPFTRAQAVEAGIDAGRLRTSAYRRLLHGVYVDARVTVTASLRARAPLAAAHAEAWASHASAGRIHGVPLPVLPEEHVSVPQPGARPSRRGVRSHSGNTAPRLVVIDGARVSAPDQLFVELAEQLELVDLVVVGDWLVRHGKVSLPQLRRFCAGASLPGARRARAAVALVRERVDSPMETRLRLLIVLAGIPEPRVNLSITDGSGLPVRRYDLSWPTVRVIVEYDGRQHVERIAQWESDIDRREAIDDDGWRILVVIARGIYAEPERTLQRIHRLLRARGLEGLPHRLRDDWRPHFPGRTPTA